MFYKVKQVADMVGISVRTLHHYDHIGLLGPRSVSPTGYRYYSDRELEKLQQILFFKELGFSLRETGEIINRSGFDRLHALKRHKQLLISKKDRLARIITSVDQTIQSIIEGIKMDNHEMFKPFDLQAIERHQEKYAAEVSEKYGDSDAYRQSCQRTARYSQDDWAKIMARGSEIFQKIAARMELSPAAPEIQKAVAEWRQHISDSFYDCTLEIFRGLGDLYVSDERFTANIDKIKSGLAQFIKQAIDIYCDNPAIGTPC